MQAQAHLDEQVIRNVERKYQDLLVSSRGIDSETARMLETILQGSHEVQEGTWQQLVQILFSIQPHSSDQL